jgi:dynamin 1/3
MIIPVQVLARLTDRRLEVEKELGSFGSDKKGSQDIFRHCRGFERAFQVMLNEANVAFKIRAVVEGHLPETLAKIPIEKRFNKNYTREICREADGYQPHLVSPERGIKRLVAEAMKLTSDHVHRFVDEIHMVLMETVREAARRSVLVDVGGGAGVTDARIAQQLDFLRLKGFEGAVIIAATQALEEWRAEAHRVAETMVQMECDYVTPSFFRELEKQWQEAAGVGGEDGHRDRIDALAAGEVSAEMDGDYDSDNESTAEAMSSPGSSAGGGGAQRAGSAGAAGSPAGPQMQQLSQRADLKVGWLDKRAGDTSNLQAVPVDSVRWQKRYFVLAMEAGILYYYSDPKDVNIKNPRVSINMRECIVDDFQPEGAGMPTRKSTQRLDNNAGSVSLLIRISHRNPNLPIAKAHNVMVLRAADAADKYDWLARLRNATEPGAGTGKGPRIAGNSAQYLGQQGPAGAGGRPLSPDSQQKANSGLFGRTVTKVTDKFAKFSGLGGSKLGDVMAAGSLEDLDAYYEKLGSFCGIYARAVYDRMAKTVPKAIILCQVIRSRDRLLDQLFNYISKLSPKEIEFMLQEDPTAARRRAAAQQASRDLMDAQDEVRRLQERRATAAPGTVRKESEEISVRALLLAGAYPMVPKDRVPPGVNPGLLYGEHSPHVLIAGSEAMKQLGPAIGKRAPSPTDGAAVVGGDVSSHNGLRSGLPVTAAAGAAAASAATAAAAKPRRLPPPPPSSS